MRTEFGKMYWALTFCLSGLVPLVLAPPANAQDAQGEVGKVLVLQPSPDGLTSGPFGHTGQAGAVHIEVEEGQTTLRFSLTGLTPNAVHSVWLLLDTGAIPENSGQCGGTGQPPCGKCGATGQPACVAPFVSCSGPQCVALDPGTGTINVFPFTPAAADDAGFRAGMALDPNGFATDADGNAEFKIKLNYDIFQANVAPLVLRPGATEGLAVAFDALGTTCSSSLFNPNNVTPSPPPFPARIDSGYVRVYNTATVPNLPAVSPSYQLLDSNGKPRLVRAGVKAFELIEHFDRVTHGHVPGFHVINPMALSCGDFDNRLFGKLADAVADDKNED